MKTSSHHLILFSLLAGMASWGVFSMPASAQPPGRGGFGGGPPSGGFGDRGRGGPPDGDRGSSFGRGGPPGGDRGSSFGRGGPPGGDRGSSFGRGGPPGGDRGGFDPSGFLSRLDRNGNGTLDPDEQQGPAQFLIQRLQSVDPSIKSGQPISIKRVTEAFQKSRGGDSGGDSKGGSSDPRRSSDDALTADLLVPDFRVETDPVMLPGFGPTAEMMSVAVTDADRNEARQTLGRYDRNRDGVLTKDELSSRFSGNPMDFDRNKDGRLTEGELAVRYARRRTVREEDEGRSRESSRRSSKKERSVSVDDMMEKLYGDRKSYRIEGAGASTEGVPGFFTDKDANQDGQVTMAEFASEWTDELLQEFFKSDLNRDGIITVQEVIASVEQNDRLGPPASSMASTGASSNDAEASSGSSSSASKPAGPTEMGKPSESYVKFAARIMKGRDKNGDGKLTRSEWADMALSPAAADFDRDGSITVEEYAWWMEWRRKNGS